MVNQLPTGHAAFRILKTIPDGGVVAQVIHHETMADSAHFPTDLWQALKTVDSILVWSDIILLFFLRNRSSRLLENIYFCICRVHVFCVCLCEFGEESGLRWQLEAQLLDYCNGPVSYLTIIKDWMQLLRYEIGDNSVFVLIKARVMGRGDEGRK